MLPCQVLDPDLVMMLTTEPEFRPYSESRLLVTVVYCWTKLGSLRIREGPATLLSLLLWPSICWSLFRPRRPLVENPKPPLVLEKLLSREETTPGTKRTRASRPSLSCIPAKLFSVAPETVVLI